MPRDTTRKQTLRADPIFAVIILLTLLVPLVILPNRLENAFFAPKALLIFAGISLLLGITAIRFVHGRPVHRSSASTPYWLLVLIALNFSSFFYTENYYHTKVAALLNLNCLLLFYFVSLHVDSRRAVWILAAVAVSGVLITALVYLQFSGHYLLIQWARPKAKVMGTIGNSNYLGAYLLFPVFALAGLSVLAKGKFRWLSIGLLVFVLGALLFSRARASWLGLVLSGPVFLILIRRIYAFSVMQYVRSHPKRLLGYAAILLVLVAGLGFMAPDRFYDRLAFSKWTKTKTLGLRWNKYFRASWWLFKENPLLGTGLWSYRNRVYDAQAEIHKKDPSFFKGYEKPQPRRVHNEYLEILNDGGLVAAAFLFVFVFVVLKRHGWQVIRDPGIPIPDRVVAATAFSALTGILTAALFFFSFRLSSTLFLTALMMGIIEGVYLRNAGLLSETQQRGFPLAHLVSAAVVAMLLCLFFFRGYRPFQAELAYFQYKQAAARQNARAAETRILRALTYDPHNSLYCLYAGQLYMNIIRNPVKAGEFFERALVRFNGDLTMWDLYYVKGLLEYKKGSLFDAKYAFEKALYYNPNFLPARNQLKKVDKILKENDKILIRLR
jgi:O-antigen ligase